MKKNPITIKIGTPMLLIIAGTTFLPVWKSGSKTGLNLWEFLKNHTIWYDGGSQYLPDEMYIRQGDE